MREVFVTRCFSSDSCSENPDWCFVLANHGTRGRNHRFLHGLPKVTPAVSMFEKCCNSRVVKRRGDPPHGLPSSGSRLARSGASSSLAAGSAAESDAALSACSRPNPKQSRSVLKWRFREAPCHLTRTIRDDTLHDKEREGDRERAIRYKCLRRIRPFTVLAQDLPEHGCNFGHRNP